MRTIWKYPLELELGRYFEITMPRGAKILGAMAQDDVPTLWAEVDHTTPWKEVRRFRIVGTGAFMNFKGSYIGSLQTHGLYVWHIYELED